MAIRAGDSLLFTAGVGATGTLHIAVMDGSNQVCQTREGVTGEKLPVRFDQGGTFTVIASVDGISVGSLIVHVVYIDFDGPVACQVGYKREKGVAVYGPTDQVFFTAKDPALLEVSVKQQTSYGVRLYLKALRRGTPVVQARLGSATGPILAEQELDEFILDTSAVQHLVVNGETDTANTILTMKPWIPNVDINFAMYAHYSTFAGGATAYTLNTSDQTSVDINGDPAIDLSVDPTTGETQAVIRVDIEIPADEDSYCFSASYDQHSKYGTVMGCDHINGTACDLTPVPIYIAEGDLTPHVLVVNERPGTGNVTHDPGPLPPAIPDPHKHTMTPWSTDDGLRFKIVAPSDKYNCLAASQWNASVELKAAAKAGNKLSAKICGTKFEDVIRVYTIDVLRVPEYLFCSAKYWTPIKFKIQDVPTVNVSDFSALKATLFYTDKAGALQSVTINGLKNYLVAVAGLANTFECYINPANYADLTIPDKNFSESAYFVLEATITISGTTCTSQSASTDSEAKIAKKLSDKTLYAVDMTDLTTVTTVQRSECAIDTDPIAKWETMSLPVDYGVNVAPKDIWSVTYIDRAYDTSGTEGSPAMPYWCDPKIPKYEQVRNSGVISSIIHGNCYEESIFVANSSFSSTLSAYPSTPAIESKTRLKQRNGDVWHGTYIGKNAGKRSGAYFFISYGGKDVPGILPSGQRAMDLDKVKASGRLTAYNGMAEASCTNDEGLQIDPAMAKAGLNIANIWSGLPNPYARIAGTAVQIANYALSANTPSDGKSCASVECWEAWTDDADSIEKEWQPSDTDQRQVWLVEATPAKPQDSLKSALVENNIPATKPKQVGTCVLAFVELRSTAQLKAKGTWSGFGAKSVDADARYGASAVDQADVEIVCKYTP
jgi:hypothetical protein